MKFAFYGRVSTEDQQDPEASRGWQIRRARALIEPHGGTIVEQYFDIGQSRSLPWKRRPEAARLLADVAGSDRRFDSIVIGEPQRAFYGNQFGLTFPVLTHYGVGLWVPEVGGAVDPGSEAHDMVMTLFGGMSKGERTRVQLRVKASMFDLAQRSDRFLGGRPPYGYTLADIGPHPNPGKAAAGQRAHKLVPDPVTAPVVAGIFDMFVREGASLRLVAQRLTAAEIPSPSAYDPARNKHRDPVGWAFSAVRAILSNPTYTGYRVWGKQQKVETLIDPEDVAAGNRTLMRWRDKDAWVRSERPTHEALVTEEFFEAAANRLSSGASPRTRVPKGTPNRYSLRGMLSCGICGRTMQGAFRESRRKDGTGRVLYKCEPHKHRALPAEMQHPPSVYVREDAIIGPLNQWIEKLADPETLAAGQAGDPSHTARVAGLRADLRDTKTKIAKLIASIEAGIDPALIAPQIATRQAEKNRLERQIAAMNVEHGMSPAEIKAVAQELGGLAEVLTLAEAEERLDVYESLQIKMVYEPAKRLVRAQLQTPTNAAWGFGRVRGGT